MNVLSNENSYLKGTLKVPGDKSISHRSVMLGSISEGVTKIYNFLESEDSYRTIKAFQDMGVDITTDEDMVTINGKGLSQLIKPNTELDMGNSGTTVRLLSGILTTLPFETTLIGDQSLSQRPMGRIIDPLIEMGASIKSNNGTLPLEIQGKKLTPITYKLPVDSAQVKSAVLLAGLLTKGKTTVIEPNVTRDHTERMLPIFGAAVERNEQSVSIEGNQPLRGATISIPGDVSSASFWIAGAVITPGSHLRIQDVGLNPTRIGFIDVLKRMGALIETKVARYEGDEPVGDITVRYSDNLKPVIIEKHEIAKLVDEVPLLALVATQTHGTMNINHIEELRYKESDRIKATVSALHRLGATIKETPSGITVQGKEELKGGEIESFGDHRIAMMGVIASLLTSTQVKVDDIECIKISYPNFFNDLETIKR